MGFEYYVQDGSRGSNIILSFRLLKAPVYLKQQSCPYKILLLKIVTLPWIRNVRLINTYNLVNAKLAAYLLFMDNA